MSSGFYELLGVAAEADGAAIRAAYQEQVAQTVRRLRAAEARQQDTATLEARRTALAEAMAVLGDAARRRRYDRFRELSRAGFPADLDELWRAASPSLVDPAAAAALDVVRTLTSLKVGDAFAAEEQGVEADAERTAPVSETVSGPTVTPVAVEVSADPTPVAPSSSSPRYVGAAIDRTLAVAEVQRLLDVYGPTGAWLRAAREARKLDLDALSASTKVARRFLEAMETEAWGALPAATFVRGYLRVVLRTLELVPDPDEAEEAVAAYMTRFHRSRG